MPLVEQYPFGVKSIIFFVMIHWIMVHSPYLIDIDHMTLINTKRHVRAMPFTTLPHDQLRKNYNGFVCKARAVAVSSYAHVSITDQSYMYEHAQLENIECIVDCDPITSLLSGLWSMIRISREAITLDLRKKSTIVCLLWFSVSIVFFGMVFNVGE